MKAIKYINGDATKPMGKGKKLIIHCCNDIGLWGSGFVIALQNVWPITRSEYLRWSKTPPPNFFELGEVQIVKCEEDIYVANMIAQHMVGQDEDGNPPIRYDALIKCLKRVVKMAKILKIDSIHLPYKMCCDRAGGDWEIVEKILINELISHDLSVIVYKLT